MEEIISKFKEEFKSDTYCTRDFKLAYAIGYLENCEDLSRKEAIQILHEIFKYQL